MMGPLAFTSSEGFPILVGRNNRQNDKLTMKQASNQDLWFHTKNIPGSHTILVTQGKTPGEESIRQAAMLAAYHSRAKSSSQVPVDYTPVSYTHLDVYKRQISAVALMRRLQKSWRYHLRW